MASLVACCDVSSGSARQPVQAGLYLVVVDAVLQDRLDRFEQAGRIVP